MKKSIGIADEHSIVRITLEMFMAPIYGNENIYSFQSITDLYRSMLSIDYDLIIMDMRVGGKQAIFQIPKILEIKPDQKILLYTRGKEKIMGRTMFNLGVKGYLGKECGRHEILMAVKAILEGEIYISQPLRDLLSHQFLRKNNSHNPIKFLTSREKEVMKLLVKGHTNNEIGKKCGIKISSVATYKRKVFTKMHVKNILELHDKCLAYRVI